jgi:predicted porin
MQKKIIVLSVAAAIATPALADNGNVPSFPDNSNNVSIYGHASVSFDSVNDGSAGVTQGVRTSKVSSNSSYIGFKGAEVLDDGLKAVWQVESLVSLDGATTDTLGSRNTYAGLSGDKLGMLLLGHYDTPYKLSTRRLDVFGQTLADNRSLLGGAAGTSSFTAFDGRPSNTLDYISPVLNGFTMAAAYVAGAELATVSGQKKGDIWSLAGWYDVAPFYASLAYEVHNLGAAGTGTLAGGAANVYTSAGSNESATRLGLGYKQDAFEVNLVYEKTSDNLGGTGAPAFLGAPATVVGADVYGHSTYYLAGKHNIGSDAVKVAYSRAGNLAGAAAGADTSANQLAVGYDHNLSKRTTLYALYTRLNNGTNVKYALSSAAIADGTTAASAAGAALSALSFGLQHTF